MTTCSSSRLAGIAGASLLLAAGFSPDVAAHGQTAGGQGGRISVGFAAAVGSALTGRPEDEPGEPTLLYGTGFSGSSFRFGPAASVRLLPALDGILELSVGRTEVSGFAQVDEARRDLTFKLWTLQALPMLAAHVDVATIQLHAALGLGLRVGLVATATEERRGISDDAPAPAVRTQASVPAAIELGVGIPLAAWRVQAAVRMTYALNYPSSTAGRLDGYVSTENPGEYWVETDFDTLLVLTLWKSL